MAYERKRARRRLDTTERGLDFMCQHRDEIGLGLPEGLFPCQESAELFDEPQGNQTQQKEDQIDKHLILRNPGRIRVDNQQRQNRQ